MKALAGLVIFVVVSLAGSTLAGAATGVSTVADSGTWGTAPASNGRAQAVLAVVEVGGRAYLGGAFTKLVSPGGGANVGRSHLAAVDVASRTLAPWNPNASGTVWAMALNATRTGVYVGGDFSRVAGRSASKLALIDLASGKPDPHFRPAVRGRVRTIALSGGTLYVGGDFTSVAGTARPKVAALDATTGALLSWNPPVLGNGRYVGHTGTPTPDAPSGNVYGLAVPADGSRVYVGGDFLNFAGQGGLVVLDAATGRPMAQQWTVGRPVFDLALWPGDGKTVFAAAGGPGGRLSAFDPNQPKHAKWSASVDGDAVGVAASATSVFLMGHYDYIIPKGSSCYQFCPNGTARHHLAAFDAATGAVQGWNPTADTITGPKDAVVGSNHVLVVGEFTSINGQKHPGYAQFVTGP